MRKVTLALASIALMLSAAACGTGNSDTTAAVSPDTSAAAGETAGTTGAQSTPAGQGGKITVAFWDNGQKPGLDAIMQEFSQATGYEVESQVINWDSYWTLLEAGASGGDMPDVFWMHSNEVQKYMDNDILMDLTDRVGASDKLEMDKFPEDIKELYQLNGKIYAVPKDIDTIALWYNKTMFDEAGLAYPDETWTWDDFYEAAVALTKEDGSQYGTAMNPTNNQDGFYNMIYSMGGTVLTEDKKSGFDDPNTLAAMEYVDRLVKNTMPPATVMAETGTDVLLNSGKIAMLSQGSWMVPAFKENEYIAANCDVALLPKDAATGRRVSIYNGLGWAANAGTKNPEAAWALIEWFGSKEMQLKQAQLGVTMAAYEGVSEDWKNNTDLFNLQPYLDMREDVVIRPYTRATMVWENMITANLRAAWSGESTMAEACARLTQEMNQAIEEE